MEGSLMNIHPKNLKVTWLITVTLVCLMISACAEPGQEQDLATPARVPRQTLFPTPTRRPTRTLTPVPVATSTLAPSATSAPTLPPGDTPTVSGFKSLDDSEIQYLYPFCNCSVDVVSGLWPVLRWAWLATTEPYTAEFVSASRSIMFIDGVPYSGLDNLWGPVHFDDEEQAYASSWIYPMPPLAAGKHRIEARVWLDHSLTDGYDGDKNGDLDLYGPGEAITGWVEVNLPEAVPASPAVCPNGSPPGTWALTINKSSPGEGEIMIDGIAWRVFSGKNVIFVSSNGGHMIVFDGSTATMMAPECGENTLEMP